MSDVPPFDKLDEQGRKLTALDVAQIASAFVIAGKDIPEAVGTALALLDASQWALDFMNPHGYRYGYDYGARKWAKREEAVAEGGRFEKNLPRVNWKVDDAGNPMPLPFDDALALLFPRLKVTDRMPRFRGWLAVHRNCPVIEAGEQIGALKKSGIDKNLFAFCAWTNAQWWTSELSKKRSESGKTGAARRAVSAEKKGRKAGKRA